MTSIIAVPNGTEIASATYTKLVEKYRTFAKQSAENIIRLAETLVEAKDALSEDDLHRFCDDVGLKQDGSTYRKLMKIGMEVSRFEPFVERMPNNWTTVYKLATLDKDVFERLTTDNRFSPSMTGGDVDNIIGNETIGRIEHKRDMTIDLTDLDNPTKVNVYRSMKSLERQFGFHLNVREEIVTLANNAVAAG